METKIYVNPRTKQKRLNVTSFKDEWVYQAHENNDNLPHMIEYIKMEEYNKAVAALNSITRTMTDDVEVLKEFCRNVLESLNNK